MKPDTICTYYDFAGKIVVSSWRWLFNRRLVLTETQTRRLIRDLQTSLRVMLWEKKNLEGIENESL